MKKFTLYMVPLMMALVLAVSGCSGSKPPESSETGGEGTSVSETGGVEQPENVAVVQEPETQEPEVSEEPEEPSREGMAQSPLTGLWIEEERTSLRPFAVTINNLKAAMPQSGIAEADIVYEVPVEGAINRLLAVYQSFGEEVGKIGPVRSARHYFLDLSFDFDSIYVHYGKSPQAQAAFKSLNAAHLDGLSYLDEVMFYQDSSRVRPHSTYTSWKGLYAGLETVGYRGELDAGKADKFLFSEETDVLEGAEPADRIVLPFSWYSEPWFEYNEEEEAYLRFQYDAKHIDRETGEQLAYGNIIIQLTDMWLIPGDTAGRLDMELVGSGKGYYISHGKHIPITWEKTSHEKPTRYFDEEGSRLAMHPGRTWIAIFPWDKQADIVIK